MSDVKIERAEAQLSQRRAEYEEWLREPYYASLSTAELIELAKGPKRLKAAELQALDEAWFERFGERLTDAVETSGSTEPIAPAQEEVEPTAPRLEELDNDDLMTRREVARK